jgi:hypothetical protein
MYQYNIEPSLSVSILYEVYWICIPFSKLRRHVSPADNFTYLDPCALLVTADCSSFGMESAHRAVNVDDPNE